MGDAHPLRFLLIYFYIILQYLASVIKRVETFDFYIKYRKIPNIRPGLIEVRKHFLGGYIRGGLTYNRGLFGGHFVLVSEYQDLKIHCYILQL